MVRCCTYLFILFCIGTSCTDKRNFQDVREELIGHYQQDSLKRKAALLVYDLAKTSKTHQGSLNGTYVKTIATYTNDQELQHEQLTNLKSSKNVIEIAADSLVIDAQFIIQHVDRAFQVWNDMAWKNQVSYSTFCKYILPYKIDIETPELWMAQINGTLPDSVKQKDTLPNALLAASTLLTQGKNDYRTLFGKNSVGLPVLPYSSLKDLRVGACEDLTRYGIYVSRAYGFPTAKDFTPLWANAASGHTWCALILDSSRCVPFNFKIDWWDPFLGTYKTKNRLESKVYRHGLSVNPESHAALKGRSVNYLPDFFNSPGIEDVTDQYIPVKNVSIPLVQEGKHDPIAYLAVLAGFGWTPVAWGKVVDDSARFEKVVMGAVYNPYRSADDKLFPFSYPFIVTSNGTRVFKPDYANPHKVVKLTRKFPLQENIKQFILHMIDGKFQGANKPDFSDSVDLYTVKESPGPYYQQVELKNKQAFRYYRYKGVHRTWSNVGDIEFYGENEKPVFGEPIGGEPSRKARGAQAAFDGDPVSFYEAKDWNSGWAGMAYDKAFVLRKIRFIARTDYNIIVPGNTYELFCWDGGWKSFGKKVAESNTLIYENIPSNSILYVKNLTGGSEERIFTYEDGEQVWW